MQKKFSSHMLTNFRVCLFLGLATFAVYWQVTHYEFTSFDDPDYVTKNIFVQNGFTSKSLSWAFSFSNKEGSYWHPLTWLSHILDCHLYGLNPGMHHLTNLILHIGNIMLLFLVFRRMTGSLWKSAFIAALFAFHPINVDSVAWVAERKNVLSTFFWMLTIWAYIDYCERPGPLRYLLTFLIFSTGLLVKPMLITLPFVLLLLDYWPLKRLFHPTTCFQKTILARSDERIRESHTNSTSSRIPTDNAVKNPFLKDYIKSAARPVMEKVPFLLVSAVSTYLSTSSVKHVTSLVSFEQVPMTLRISNALVSYVSYIGKTIWPQNLAVLYPYPNMIPFWKTACSGLFLVLVSVLVVRTAKQKPYLVVGWFWFLGTLVPVIGLVQAGLWPAMADRWAYVPIIGLFIMMTWSVPQFPTQWQHRKTGIAIIATLLLSILAVSTSLQLRHWANSVALFKHTTRVTTNNAIAHYNLGCDLADQGMIAEAIHHFSQAVQIDPFKADAHNRLGAALVGQGKTNEGLKHINEALQVNPEYCIAHFNMGFVLAKQGRTDEAIIHFYDTLRCLSNSAGSYNKVVARDIPDQAMLHYNLGILLSKKGKIKKAVHHLDEAIKNNPRHVKAYNLLGNIQKNQGNISKAIDLYRKALKLDPFFFEARARLGETHFMMGNILLEKGEINEAVAHFQKSLRINNNFAEAHTNLGFALHTQGKDDEAVNHLLEAIRINPDKSINAYYHLACIYAGRNKIEESVGWLKKAVDKGFNERDTLRTDKDLKNIRDSRGYIEIMNMMNKK